MFCFIIKVLMNYFFSSITTQARVSDDETWLLRLQCYSEIIRTLAKSFTSFERVLLSISTGLEELSNTTITRKEEVDNALSSVHEYKRQSVLLQGGEAQILQLSNELKQSEEARYAEKNKSTALFQGELLEVTCQLDEYKRSNTRLRTQVSDTKAKISDLTEKLSKRDLLIPQQQQQQQQQLRVTSPVKLVTSDNLFIVCLLPNCKHTDPWLRTTLTYTHRLDNESLVGVLTTLQGILNERRITYKGAIINDSYSTRLPLLTFSEVYSDWILENRTEEQSTSVAYSIEYACLEMEKLASAVVSKSGSNLSDVDFFLLTLRDVIRGRLPETICEHLISLRIGLKKFLNESLSEFPVYISEFFTLIARNVLWLTPPLAVVLQRRVFGTELDTNITGVISCPEEVPQLVFYLLCTEYIKYTRTFISELHRGWSQLHPYPSLGQIIDEVQFLDPTISTPSIYKYVAICLGVSSLAGVDQIPRDVLLRGMPQHFLICCCQQSDSTQTELDATPEKPRLSARLGPIVLISKLKGRIAKARK